ncbi:hypothetical protein GOB57_22365 [Sinorhizobium meliloti]|nr:hypothetical protein [Sinorhizobium meliloti]
MQNQEDEHHVEDLHSPTGEKTSEEIIDELTAAFRRDLVKMMASHARRAAILQTSISADEPPPSREELEDYLLFLWSEHHRVAQEIGVEPHDAMLVHRRGGVRRYDQTCPQPASSRARAVLSIAGFAGQQEATA